MSRADIFALISPTLINTRNGERKGQAPRVRDIEQPYPTITAKGVRVRWWPRSSRVTTGGHETMAPTCARPWFTITTKDHHALVHAFLIKYYGTDQDPRLESPLGTVTTKHRFGLVTVEVDGEPYVITDIGMRMLVPRELARATSLPDAYVLDPEYEGKPLTQRDQVWMIGNAVPPVQSESLVRANFSELVAERAA